MSHNAGMRKPKRQQIFARYQNVGGKSKVERYHLAKDAVTIEFADCSKYIYTNQSATPVNIAKMKELAVAGKGLDAFIDKNVKDRFERKIR